MGIILTILGVVVIGYGVFGASQLLVVGIVTL